VKSILSCFRQREKKGVEVSTVFWLVFPTRWYGHGVRRRRGAESFPIVCLSLFPTIFYGREFSLWACDGFSFCYRACGVMVR